MYLIENNEYIESTKLIILFYFLFILILIVLFQKSSSFYEKESSPSIQIQNETQIFSIKEINPIPSYNINKIENSYNKFIEEYLSSIPSKYILEKNYEREQLTYLFSLKNLSNDSTSNDESKQRIIEKYKIDYKKNFSKLENLFINKPIAFGNTIICLNNVIFYCEVIGCKNIFLNSEHNWYIKNKIINNNITISLIPSSQINCNISNTICMSFEGGLCINPYFIKQKIRINILKDEILGNLPKVSIHPKDLYIHIRSGDIFSSWVIASYSQPPLCFYQKIIHQFKFRKIYIISIDDKNPVIGKLLKKYRNVRYKMNSLETDIAYLTKAYNLVGSVSSFSLAAMKLNNNLKKYWEYDLYRLHAKFFHLHHDIYSFPRNFTIFRMKPSENYKNEMFRWANEKNQIDLMLHEKCHNNFFLLK